MADLEASALVQGHHRIELVGDGLPNAIAACDPVPGVVFHSDRDASTHPSLSLPGPAG
jgi:hypothetical protein